MAKERGWWTLTTTVEPSTTDLEHIASLIEQGYTDGEIVEDEALPDDNKPCEMHKVSDCVHCHDWAI